MMISKKPRQLLKKLLMLRPQLSLRPKLTLQRKRPERRKKPPTKLLRMKLREKDLPLNKPNVTLILLPRLLEMPRKPKDEQLRQNDFDKNV